MVPSADVTCRLCVSGAVEARDESLKYTSGDMAVAVVLSIIFSLIVGALVGFLVPYVIRSRRRRRHSRSRPKNLETKSPDGHENHYLKTVELTSQNHHHRHHAPVQSPTVPNYNANTLRSYPEKPLNNVNNVNILNNDLIKSQPNKDTNVGTPGQTSRKFYV